MKDPNKIYCNFRHSLFFALMGALSGVLTLVVLFFASVALMLFLVPLLGLFTAFFAVLVYLFGFEYCVIDDEKITIKKLLRAERTFQKSEIVSIVEMQTLVINGRRFADSYSISTKHSHATVSIYSVTEKHRFVTDLNRHGYASLITEE